MFDFKVKIFSLYAGIHNEPDNQYETMAIGNGIRGIVSFFSPEKDKYEVYGREKTYLFFKNNTVSWYNDRMAEYQCNSEYYRYFYFVIY